MTYTKDEATDFIDAYAVALIWTGVTGDGEGDLIELDQVGYTVEHLSSKARAEIRDQCKDFLDVWADVVRDLDYGSRGAQWSNFELAGHDFLLTRQGQGVGFWDRGLGLIGDALSEWSRAYGDMGVEVSDKGKLEVY